jgi:Acyl-CoA carboxylase epsilon subunit
MERIVVAPPVNDDRPAGRSGRPYLRVVRGDATPEELAALVAVLLSRSAEADAAPAPPRSAWSDRSRQLRRPLYPGPGAWRRSALPG